MHKLLKGCLGLLIFTVAVIISYSFYSRTQFKNVLDNRNFLWGFGWKDYSTQYSGSEFNFLVTDNANIRIDAIHRTKADQGLEVFIDGKKINPLNSNTTGSSLNFKISRNKHEVRVRYFCTHFVDPCKLDLLSVSIDYNGKILPYIVDKKILSVIGDSISTIYGNNNYTFLLADELGYQIHNVSIHGSGIIEGKVDPLNRIVRDVKPFPSDVILIFLGTNDAAKNVNPNNFRGVYSEMVRSLKEWNPKARILLAGILWRSDIDETILQKYNAIIKEQAINFGLEFVDTASWLGSQDLSDPIHPSVESQHKIARNFTKILN